MESGEHVPVPQEFPDMGDDNLKTSLPAVMLRCITSTLLRKGNVALTFGELGNIRLLWRQHTEKPVLFHSSYFCGMPLIPFFKGSKNKKMMIIMNNVRCVTWRYAFLTGFKIFPDTQSKYLKLKRKSVFME